MIYLQKMLNDEDGRKTPKYKNERENQGKITRLVALPLIRLTSSNALVNVYLWRRASPLCREYNKKITTL